MKQMMEQIFFTPLLGIDFYHTAFSFFFYGVACWCMECVFESIRQKKLVMDRGFNKGPICTIYGVAFLFVYFVMKPLDGKWIPLYIVGALYATTLEYVTAVVMDKVFHQKWWDYTDMPLNFQGRICLPISLAWGILVVLMFAVFQPHVMMLIDLIPVRIGLPVLQAMIWVYFIDLAFSIVSRSKVGKRAKEKIDVEKERIKYYFRDGDM